MLILDYDELCKLTGESVFEKQSKALTQMGIFYGERPDGFPIVTVKALDEFIDMSAGII